MLKDAEVSVVRARVLLMVAAALSRVCKACIGLVAVGAGSASSFNFLFIYWLRFQFFPEFVKNLWPCGDCFVFKTQYCHTTQVFSSETT